MTRVFLTGGSGLIGGALAARLIERGDQVVALARSEAAAAKLSERGATTVRGDVLDEGALTRGMEGCDLLYHVAGVNALCTPDPAGMLRVNIEGAKLAVRAAAQAGVRRVVLTSSAAAIGEAKGAVGSESSPHRGSYMSVYERSKHQGEVAALAEAKRSGIEIVAINPSSVQGPGRAHGTGKILIAYLNGKLKAFIDTRISIVDIDDCIEAHLLGAERGTDGERYLINSATMTSLEALELVTKISGVKHDVRLVPPVLARGVAVAVEGVFRVRRKTAPVCREMITTMLHGHHYDGSRAARELGFAYTPAEDTFRRTIEWARSKGLVTG